MKAAALKKLRAGRFFDGWDGFLDDDKVKAADDNLRRLIDDVLALGPKPTEKAVRKAVDACVMRFNKMDDEGWINTIEREDIGDKVGDVVELCGFEYDEDWLGERDW